MSDGHRLAQDCADAQIAMFREFVFDNGGPGTISRAELARRSGIPDSTLKGWASHTAMPLHGFLALSYHLPAEALNVLTGIVGKRLTEAETQATSWNDVAADLAGMVAQVCDALRDQRVDHIEEARLKRTGRKLIAELQAVVGQ